MPNATLAKYASKTNCMKIHGVIHDQWAQQQQHTHSLNNVGKSIDSRIQNNDLYLIFDCLLLLPVLVHVVAFSDLCLGLCERLLFYIRRRFALVFLFRCNYLIIIGIHLFNLHIIVKETWFMSVVFCVSLQSALFRISVHAHC